MALRVGGVFDHQLDAVFKVSQRLVAFAGTDDLAILGAQVGHKLGFAVSALILIIGSGVAMPFNADRLNLPK
jgi:hypothetical protein